MEKTIEIPEGYEVRIEGNKVILEPKESEDERLKGQLLWQQGYETGKIAAKQEQKPAKWSEEDEKILNDIIDYMLPMPLFFESVTGKSGKEFTQEFMEKATTFLKALPERFNPQPKVEWGEDDEKMFEAFLHKLEVCDLLTNKEIRWAKLRFKFLRPQPHWKPSKEQMNSLEYFIKLWGNSDGQMEYVKVFNDVKLLYQQLKKL